MTQTQQTSAAKLRRAAILGALPFICLLSLLIWTVMGTSVTVLALLVDLDIIGIALGVMLFAPPAAWANWHVARLAIAAGQDAS